MIDEAYEGSRNLRWKAVSTNYYVLKMKIVRIIIKVLVEEQAFSKMLEQLGMHSVLAE